MQMEVLKKITSGGECLHNQMFYELKQFIIHSDVCSLHWLSQ